MELEDPQVSRFQDHQTHQPDGSNRMRARPVFFPELRLPASAGDRPGANQVRNLDQESGLA
jgi:hypothetical protein